MKLLRHLRAALLLSLALSGIVDVASAAPVIADFNDCALGDLREGKTNNQPANTGTGFGAPFWEGNTGVVVVVNDDLVVPAATRYAVAQTGAGRSVQTRGASSSTRRQQYREIEQPLTGTVWGSFVVRPLDATTHSGLTFNVPHIDPLNRAGQGRLYVSGRALVLHAFAETTPIVVPEQFATGQTALVLFRFESATRQLTVWINPVLADAARDLSAATAAFHGTCDLVGSSGGIRTLGIGGYTDTTATASLAIFDSLRFSDESGAYYAVTGLPATPEIQVPPQSRTLVRGRDVTFSVVAIGQGELVYQWEKDGVELTGANSPLLTLTAIDVEASGAYRVRIRDLSSGASVVSPAAELTVLASAVPVSITSHPQSRGVVAGAAVEFSVVANGAAPLSYQWQRNGVALAGANNATLRIDAVQPKDAGAYRVVIENPAGSVVSQAASLSVDVAPQIVAAPQNTESFLGGEATFVVEAAGTALNYTWRRGSTIVGENSAVLALSALRAEDAGSYTVTVSNALGEFTSVAASLTIRAETPPLAGTQLAAADSFIENGEQTAAPRNGLGLRVGARSAAGAAYKAYLAFNLPLAARAREVSSASLTLTLDPTEPLLSGANTSTASLLPSAAATRLRKGFEGVAQTYLSVGPATAGADVYRSLITFDLASLAFVPASMKLRLTVAAKWSGAPAGVQTLRLYRVTRDWVQGQATWTRASSEAEWTTPGADFSPTILSQVTADPSSVAVGQTIEFPDTPALRQALLEVLDTSGQLQLIVVAANEDGASNRVFQFHPRGVVGQEPVLVLPPGAVANNAPKNPLRVRLHGVVDNRDAWNETTLAWNNAPAKADAISSPGAGALPLAELTLDSGALQGGASVTFSDPRLTQFLNWAAGRRGALYGNGHASDADRRITFVLTAIDGGEIFPGVKFQDRESGAGPQLHFVTAANAPALGTRVLENERFRVELIEDLAVNVTDKRDGATARFEAAFEAISQVTSPGFSRHTYNVNPTPLSLATWNANFNYGAAPGERVALRPTSARASDGGIVWSYAPGSPAFAFRAALDLPAGEEFPRLRWTLTPSGTRHFAVAFQPLEAVPNTVVSAFYLPGVWNGRRFPENQFVIDEVRATLPAVFRESGGVVSGVAVDAFELPNRVATFVNSLFGLMTNDATAALNRPTVLAPLYGGAGSRTDGTLSFSVRLIVGGAGLDQSFRDVAASVFGFHDYRENLRGGSLNTALDNLVDFILNRSGQNYSYWRENEKANEYVNDHPAYVRFQSAPTALGLAMVRDDVDLYERRARPTIEYFISREGQMMKFDDYDAAYGMGGPVSGYYATDFYALFGLMGGRTWAFLPLAEEARAVNGASLALGDVITPGQPLTRSETYDRMFDTLHSLIAGYRATGLPEYLADARWLTDEYLRHRYESPLPTDFRDVRSSFWNQVSGRWESLLEMHELTGEPRYAAAAARALNEFARHINFGPAISTLTVDGLGVPVSAAAVSEVGLTSEATATSVSHRGIFMSAYASPSFLRGARLHNDPFFTAVGRAGIVGRWLNYPGYTIRNNYNAVLLRGDYPLRWYSSYANTAHMNHPLPLAAMAIDYLMADAELKSAGAIKFPHHFTDSRGYFRGRLFGGEPGEFYGDANVWPWLPRALVQLAGFDAAQLNYVAGHGNGRLYVAFLNQSPRSVEATVTFDPARVTLAAGARMRVWRDNIAEAESVFANGVTTVRVAPHGITAIAIDDAVPHLGLQADYLAGSGAPLGADSYARRTASFGRVVGAVVSLGPTRQHAYVYTDAEPSALASSRLRYRIDGGGEHVVTKAEFPFEFSVSLPAGARTFAYVLEAVKPGGATSASEEITLTVDAKPVVLTPPTAQTTVAGRAVTLTISTVGDGALSYQWRRNGEAIAGATSAQLTLTGAPSDAGAYDVLVTNEHGTTVSPSAEVTVELGNLLAYALGRAGDEVPPLLAPTIDAASERLALEFIRARDDVIYTVQASSDLNSWIDVAVDPGVVGERATVFDPVALTETKTRFLRLRVALR